MCLRLDGLFIYAVMALASAAAMIWRHPLADLAAREAAPIGAGFTLVCLAAARCGASRCRGHVVVWDAAADLGAGALLPLSGYSRWSAPSTTRRAVPAPAPSSALVGAVQPAGDQILGPIGGTRCISRKRLPPRRTTIAV